MQRCLSGLTKAGLIREDKGASTGTGRLEVAVGGVRFDQNALARNASRDLQALRSAQRAAVQSDVEAELHESRGLCLSAREAVHHSGRDQRVLRGRRSALQSRVVSTASRADLLQMPLHHSHKVLERGATMQEHWETCSFNELHLRFKVAQLNVFWTEVQPKY